jgi:hypothetical protein
MQGSAAAGKCYFHARAARACVVQSNDRRGGEKLRFAAPLTDEPRIAEVYDGAWNLRTAWLG